MARDWRKAWEAQLFTPAPTADEVDALASILDYQDGTRAEHALIQYLNERKANELTWLETLARSDIPTALMWGRLDAIAPSAVPDYVWRKYLKVGRRRAIGRFPVPITIFKMTSRDC